MSDHTVSTTHIQHLIKNGLMLAELCDGQGQRILDGKYTIDALEKAAADLRHGAEELTAERLSLNGWPQV